MLFSESLLRSRNSLLFRTPPGPFSRSVPCLFFSCGTPLRTSAPAPSPTSPGKPYTCTHHPGMCSVIRRDRLLAASAGVRRERPLPLAVLCRNVAAGSAEYPAFIFFFCEFGLQTSDEQPTEALHHGCIAATLAALVPPCRCVVRLSPTDAFVDSS